MNNYLQRGIINKLNRMHNARMTKLHFVKNQRMSEIQKDYSEDWFRIVSNGRPSY